MTYNEFIQNIIDTRGQWNIKEGEYWEGHHIIPRCKGGTGRKRSKDENIIWLYPREHFIAHKLLALENPTDMKLVSAYSMMAFPKSLKNKYRYELTPEEYEEARIFCNNAQSEIKKGKPGRKGWHHSDETRKKLSQLRMGKEPWNKGITGTHMNLTEEQRIKKSNSMKKLWENPEYRKKVVDPKIGRKQSDEVREKHREKAKGNTNVRGMHWYNNGVELIRAYECPEGFVRGIGKLRNNKNQYTNQYAEVL